MHLLQHNYLDSLVPKCWIRGILSTFPPYLQKEYANHCLLGASVTKNLSQLCQVPSTLTPCCFVIKSIDVTLANHVIFWPREMATLLKSNLRYFHREKSTFEKFDAGLKLRIVSYTHKTIKNRRKNFRVMNTLKLFYAVSNVCSSKCLNFFAAAKNISSISLLQVLRSSPDPFFRVIPVKCR